MLSYYIIIINNTPVTFYANQDREYCGAIIKKFYYAKKELTRLFKLRKGCVILNTLSLHRQK